MRGRQYALLIGGKNDQWQLSKNAEGSLCLFYSAFALNDVETFYQIDQMEICGRFSSG
jgi:hypothetical protein